MSAGALSIPIKKKAADEAAFFVGEGLDPPERKAVLCRGGSRLSLMCELIPFEDYCHSEESVKD